MVQTFLRITRIAHRKSYLIIIWPNSHEKLTKREIRPSSSRFEHCSESLIQPIGSHIWSLFSHIHMKRWPKVCVYSSIETAPLCKILEQSDNYSLIYCISNNWGIQKCWQFMCQSSHWQLCLCCIKFKSNRTITYGDIAFWPFGGYSVSFSSERSCSSPRRVSNFNSNVPQGGGGIYTHITFERDPSNVFRIKAFTSSGSTGSGGRGGDAKTIISPNTSFGDIITK